MKGTISFTAGRLLCSQVRDHLKKRQFIDQGITWIESTGWLEREFTVKGDEATLKDILCCLEKWQSDMDAVEKT